MSCRAPLPERDARNGKVAVSLLDGRLLTTFAIAKILIVLSLVGFFHYSADRHGNNLWNRFYASADRQNSNLWNTHTAGEEDLDAIYLPFSNWDGQHYLLLAERGYAHWRYGQAFFPLYPLLISLVTVLLKNIYLSAFLLNLLLSYLMAYAFFAYSKQYVSRETALKGLILVLSYPTAFFLTVFYSEALFLLLLLGFLYQYDVRRSYTSLVFALLLPLSRGQAIFVPAALVIFVAIRMLKKEPVDYAYEASNLFAFLFGGMLYLSFFYFASGSAFVGLNAQKDFIFGNDIANIFNPAHFIAYLFTPSTPGSVFAYTYSLVDKVFVILFLLAIAIILARPGRLLWVILSIALFYPVAAMGNGGSFTRLSLPAMVILMLAIEEAYPMRRGLFYAVALLQSGIQLYFVYRFSLNLWVG